jgi:hypothetical protein
MDASAGGRGPAVRSVSLFDNIRAISIAKNAGLELDVSELASVVYENKIDCD